MKKISAILLLALFCVYSFTFKTHYCYYADTHDRFHGDCNLELKEATSKGKLANTNFFPKHYICQDILKNAQVRKEKILTVKSISSIYLLIPSGLEIPKPTLSSLDWNIPEPQCRSASLFLSITLRAPPLC